MKNILLMIVFPFVVQLSFAQEFKGKILDAETKEGIPFANIYIKGIQVNAISDSIGNFSIDVPLPKEINVLFGASFYESKLMKVNSLKFISVDLIKSHLELDEVLLRPKSGTMQRDNIIRVDRLLIKDLNTIPVSNLSEALSNINGVQEASMGPGISKPVIRGMQGVRVLSVLNGMRLENQQWGADHGLGISQLGIGALEVIKGPNSLLYGVDAFGGVVYIEDEKFESQNVYSANINSKFESVNLGYTNSAVIKLSKKKFRFNLGALHSSFSDFQMPNGKYLEDSRYEDMGVKTRISYNTNNWVMNMYYMFSHSYNGIPGHTHDSIPDSESFMSDFQNRQRDIPAQNINNHLFQLNNKFFLGKNKIDLMLGYTNNSLNEYDEKFTIPGLGMSLQNILYHLRYNITSGSWTIKSGIQGMYQINKNIAEAEEQLIPDFKQLDNGIYSMISYKTNSNFSFQFGGRYDLRNLDASDDFSSIYSSPNFSIGGKYEFGSTNKNTLLLNISSGFRAPHVSELLVNGKHHGALRYEVGNPNLESERALQFDLNYELNNEHLSFVFNPYYNYINNYTQILAQDSIVENLPLFNFEQIDEAQLYGFDTKIHFHPHFAHWLHLEGSYSLIYGESLNRSENIALIPQPRLNFVLRVKFKKRFKFNLEEIVVQNSHFFAQNRVTTYETTSSGYDLSNIGLKFKWFIKTPLEINFGVKNIFNTEYINHLSRLKNIGVFNPGRNFYISLNYLIKGNLN